MQYTESRVLTPCGITHIVLTMIDTDWPDEAWRPFGPDVRAWFRARLDAEFRAICEARAIWAAARNRHEVWLPYRVAMIAWFTTRAERFVRWVPADCYRGDGWSAGAWELNRSEIEWSFREAKEGVLYPDLDSWLLADIERSVAWSPREESAWFLLNDEQQERYEAHAWRVSRQWPIVCRDCGQEFRRDRAKTVRCRECRDQARAARRARNAQA